MRIPEDIVSLLEALPVEEVARRLGVAVRRHMAICFMHDDHHPSLAFNPAKNTFYCFACQKGGDPIRLVQEHQGWAFPEACAWLANQFGIPLQEDDAAVPKPTIPLPRKKTLSASSTKHRQIDREVGEWLLAHVGLSPVARAFLFASRRYRPEVVRQLRIASLTDSAAMAARLERRFGSERCRTSGFFWDDEASTLIFDSPCLLFPYFTPQGELCSIQSRYLGDNPQTPRFRFPKEVRQGLFNVPVLSALRPDEPLFLAEGVTDCLALLSSGRRAVAFPAAGIHPEEDVALLAGRRLFMYPDRDDAGERLFLKLNEMLQPFATVVHRLPLDEGCKDFSDMYMAQASAQQPWDAGSQPTIGGAPSGGGLPSPKHPNNQALKQSSPMTVKEVFDLRKQGRLEEAYEAIRPMYAVHKGKYTTLCMFWVGSDILKLRLSEKRTSEAAKIFEALLRVAPAIDDQDHKVHEAVLHDALRLKEALPTFSMLQFMQQYGVDRLTDADWQSAMSQPAAGSSDRPHPLPSTAQRIITLAFHELQQHPDAHHAQLLMPLLQEASRRRLRDKHTRRYTAVALHLAGDDGKAADIYRDLLRRHHDSYLYAELAALTDAPGPKAALLCRAILNQRQEKFCAPYRLALARLLVGHDDCRAAYELQRCLATREKEGYRPTRDLLQLQRQLSSVVPVAATDQHAFYRRMADKYPVG